MALELAGERPEAVGGEKGRLERPERDEQGDEDGKRGDAAQHRRKARPPALAGRLRTR